MDSSPPGSSVRGILQAGTLEWVAVSSSRGSSQPRDGICIPDIAGGFFTAEAPDAPRCVSLSLCTYIVLSLPLNRAHFLLLYLVNLDLFLSSNKIDLSLFKTGNTIFFFFVMNIVPLTSAPGVKFYFSRVSS